MDKHDLVDKLSKLAPAIVKQVPTKGPVISLIDELNSIWRDDPEFTQMITTIEADIIENITKMYNEREKAIAFGLDDLAIGLHNSANWPIQNSFVLS